MAVHVATCQTSIAAEILAKPALPAAPCALQCAHMSTTNVHRKSWSHPQSMRATHFSGSNPTGWADFQARKRHININFLVRLLLGHPGNVVGTNRACPRDKVGLSQGQTQVFSLLYTVEAQFVPGTNPVCPGDIPGTKGGRKSLCVKSLCAFFVP